MPFFLNPWVLNLVYLVVGIIAGSSQGDQHPILTIILFVAGLNILFYGSSYLTKKFTQQRRDDD